MVHDNENLWEKQQIQKRLWTDCNLVANNFFDY